MTLLKKLEDDNGCFQVSEAGTIASLALMLEKEYAIKGYSIDQVEIEVALIADFLFYSGWESTEQQKKGIEANLDRDYIVHVHEWAIIDDLVRAHCELLQATRMEAVASIGAERHGLSVSEADQAYKTAKEEMKGLAFVEESFVI